MRTTIAIRIRIIATLFEFESSVESPAGECGSDVPTGRKGLRSRGIGVVVSGFGAVVLGFIVVVLGVTLGQ